MTKERNTSYQKKKKKKILFLKTLIDESEGGNLNPGHYMFSKSKLWLPSQKDTQAFFLRELMITPFLNRLSLPSEVGAEETGSLSMARWQPTSASD